MVRLILSLPLLEQEYACRKVRELGLESGEAIDATVLEGKVYRHLDAMRYRLRLLQTLVSLTSHVITQAQVRSPLVFHFSVGSFFQGYIREENYDISRVFRIILSIFRI